MERTARPLVLVTTPVPQSREVFAHQVLHAVQQCGDVASEACWQQFARLVVEHWTVLSNDQQPKDTWTMLSKCTEMVLKIRKASQGQGTDGQKDLEEFRDFMRGVLNVDGEE